MQKREELEGMSKKIVATICKNLGLTRYENGKELTKVELIDKIIANEYNSEKEASIDVSNEHESVTEQNVESNVSIVDVVEDENKSKKEVTNDGFEATDGKPLVGFVVKETSVLIEEFKKKDKERYIIEAGFGTIIAFHDTNENRVYSAAITNRSKSKRLLKVETSYGKEFTISFDDVLWVRTTNNWPNAIFRLFKCKGKEKVIIRA